MLLMIAWFLQLIPEGDSCDDESRALQPYADSTSTTEIVSQWNVLQFNTGSTASFIVKCGANSSSELVIKADARVEEPKGGEIIRVVPRPSVLSDMSFEDIKKVFDQLPEAISLLALARTADGTRARYSRLYRTLASKVPSLKDLVAELDKGGILKDVRTWIQKYQVYFQLVPLHKLVYPVKSTPLVEAPDIANVYLCGLQEY